MTIMDPWSVVGINASVPQTANSLKFEDNFAPLPNEALPDSEQYLAILEAKLRKIKNDPNVLKQLSEKREACMQNLLNGSSQFEEYDELDAPLGNSQLLRTILPQKQALNKGEIVELLNYDQLLEEETETESQN